MMIMPSFAHSRSQHAKESDRIVNSFVKELKKKENVSLFGYGGAFMKDVEEIDIDLSVYKFVDINEARKMLVSSVEDLLKKINSDSKIRPYLHNYPFTNKNLTFYLHFYDKNGKEVMPPHISSAGLMFGNIVYSLKNLKDPMLYDDIHQETYDEALKIYKSESSNGNQNL